MRLLRFLSVSNLLRADGLIALVFGTATLLFQQSIFSTAVDLQSAGFIGNGQSLAESTLYNLSGFYVFVGSAQIALASAPQRYANRLAALSALHHGFLAVKGVLEAYRPWMTGNPWHDVVIHSTFAALYATTAFLSGSAEKENHSR